MTTSTNCEIKGTYFESCNCHIACPCVFLEPLTTGVCTLLIAWQIESGNYGGTGLGGLNVALAAHSLGNMIEVDWKVALYIDNRANSTQEGNLTQIFSGQAGGHFAAIAQHVGEVVGVSPAEMDYKSHGKERSPIIKGIGQMEIQGLDAIDGSGITINKNPLGVVPDEATVIAKSKSLTYQNHGLTRNLSGRTDIILHSLIKGDKNLLEAPFSQV